MATQGRTRGQIKRAINERLAQGRGTVEFSKRGLDWDFLDALTMRGEIGAMLIGDDDIQILLTQPIV